MSVVDDKENLGEVNEARSGHHSDDDGDDASDAGTERRTSILSSSSMTGTSYMYTDSELSTNSGRTVSYASSIGGTINGQTESIAEEDEDEADPDEQGHEQALVLVDTNLDVGQNNSMAPTVLDDFSEPPAIEEGRPQIPADDQHQVDAIDTDTFDFAPPPLITDMGMKYDQSSQVHGSDSGLGTEPMTAQDHPTGEALEYFQMTAAEMRTSQGVGSGS
jgi:hypothetical protein